MFCEAREVGHVRSLKLGTPQGSNSSRPLVDFVFYNEIYYPLDKKKKSTRRRGGKKSTDAPAADKAAEAKVETPKSQDAENKDEA